MGETDSNTTSPRHWNGSHLYTPERNPPPCPAPPPALTRKMKKKENIKKRPYLSPTTVFPAAAKCMSSNGGPFWDWPPFTPDINARQLFLTLPFHMPTIPLHPQSERSPLRFDILLLLDLCCNKSNNSFFLCCSGERCYSVLLGMCRRDLVCISPHSVLPLCLYFFPFIVSYPG